MEPTGIRLNAVEINENLFNFYKLIYMFLNKTIDMSTPN